MLRQGGLLITILMLSSHLVYAQTNARVLRTGVGAPTGSCRILASGYGDVYVNLVTGDYYTCRNAGGIPTNSGTWTLQVGGAGNPAGSGSELQFRSSGSAFGAASGTTWDNTNRTLTWAQGTITTDNPFINFTSTWNAGGVTHTAFKFNITDTASAASSKFLDFQISAASKFSVDKTGNVVAAGGVTSGSGSSVAGNLGLGQGSATSVAANTIQLQAPSSVTGYNIVFPSTAFSGLSKWTNSSNIVTVSQATAGTDYSAPIAGGTSALGTSAIASGACATVVTTSATGTATTDVIWWGFNSDPTSTTGYQASVNGMLTIIAYPSTNNVNFKVCNNTASSITPGAVTLNWRIVR